MSSHLMNTYAPLDLAFVRGEGAWLWDEEGNRYLDAISGLAYAPWATPTLHLPV